MRCSGPPSQGSRDAAEPSQPPQASLLLPLPLLPLLLPLLLLLLLPLTLLLLPAPLRTVRHRFLESVKV